MAYSRPQCVTQCQAYRSSRLRAVRAMRQEMTQNSLNGVVTCQVVQAPAGSEAQHLDACQFDAPAHGGSCCSAQVLRSGSLKVTNDPHG